LGRELRSLRLARGVWVLVLFAVLASSSWRACSFDQNVAGDAVPAADFLKERTSTTTC
jgi:hypothetical protein